MYATSLLVWIIFLMIPSLSLGAFSFDVITENEEEFHHVSNWSCPCTTLLWNYTTDETVTVIEWYKQPGVLIARIFGVNVGAPFTVLAPYNAAPYAVTQYQTSKYNAAIKIMNVSASDEGVYSVNVTAASPQSATQIRRIGSPLPPVCDNPNVNCSTKTCNPPPNASDVTTVWTQNIDGDRCSLHNGNAACCCEAPFADCTNTTTTVEPTTTISTTQETASSTSDTPTTTDASTASSTSDTSTTPTTTVASTAITNTDASTTTNSKDPTSTENRKCDTVPPTEIIICLIFGFVLLAIVNILFCFAFMRKKRKYDKNENLGDHRKSDHQSKPPENDQSSEPTPDYHLRSSLDEENRDQTEPAYMYYYPEMHPYMSTHGHPAYTRSGRQVQWYPHDMHSRTQQHRFK